MVFEIAVWLDAAIGICAEKFVAEPFSLAPKNTRTPLARVRQPVEFANFVSAGSSSLGDALERYGDSRRPAIVPGSLP